MTNKMFKINSYYCNSKVNSKDLNSHHLNNNNLYKIIKLITKIPIMVYSLIQIILYNKIY